MPEPAAAFSLAGRTALVTGGGGGIGAATSAFLARQGAFVIVNDLLPEAAQSVADSIGSRALALAGDVTGVEETLALFEDAVARVGAVDILVNTAAAPTPIAPFVELGHEEWAAGLSSLYSTLACTKAVLPGMIERGFGRIVNVTSISGVFGVVDMSLYSAGKGGVHAFTAALAKEVAGSGVTVNCVAPGTVDTPRQRARDPQLRAARQAAVPLGRFALPEEVASAIGYFASDEAAYVTGEVLLVDGGRP
jgi:NAD(P)-dependent dehydrogenase (short-subunit alcohol dehydrogenase family)